jgi:hypothetical protein
MLSPASVCASRFKSWGIHARRWGAQDAARLERIPLESVVGLFGICLPAQFVQSKG